MFGSGAVLRRHQPDLVRLHHRRRLHAHVEQVRVDAIAPRQNDSIADRAGRPLPRTLRRPERLVAFDLVRQQPARPDGSPSRADDAHLPLRDNQRWLHRHAEQIRVDAVLARRQDVDLRPLLPAVAQESLAVLKAVMRLDAPAEDVPGVERPPIDRFDQPHLVLGDDQHVVLRYLVDERWQEVQPRLQHPRLHADLAAHRHDAALRQRLAEVPPLDQPHLLPADVGQHAAEQHEDQKHKEHKPGDDENREWHATFLSDK